MLQICQKDWVKITYINLVDINAHIKLIKFYQTFLKILSGNENLTLIKGPNSVLNLRKIMRTNPNLDLININAYMKFGQIIFISSQDIERKRICDISQRAITLLQICEKVMCNNHNQHLVNINTYTKFCRILSIFLNILSGNENLTSIKGHNSVTNMRKTTGNNPNLDLVNIIAQIKFGQILSISSQDIERKRNSEQMSGISQGP